MITLVEEEAAVNRPSTKQVVNRTVQERLKQCPYSFIFSRVTCCFDMGRLVLSGSVPSFYLKQILQEVLRNIEHVSQIENNVDVVSSTGLSSEPRRTPAPDEE